MSLDLDNLTCKKCGCLVRLDKLALHDEWHEQLSNLRAELIRLQVIDDE